jgi:steroid delta-isomerase-like uncharacterized protein
MRKLQFSATAAFMIAFFLLYTMSSCSSEHEQPKLNNGEGNSVETNKQLVKRFIEALNDTSWNEVKEILTDDYQHHLVSGGEFEAVNWNGFEQGFRAVRSGFPDWKLTIEKMVAEGDQVAVIVKGEGTHQNDFAGISASNRNVKAPISIFFQIQSGRIKSDWEIVNTTEVIKQLQQ